MRTGLDSYDFKEKRLWRIQVWNRIKKGLLPEINSKRAIGIYLPGPYPFDVDVARLKGFKKSNLIAVDFNGDNISNLRKAGLIGIEAKIQDIISNWVEPKLAFANIDLCCGLTKQSNELWDSIWNSKCFLNGAVIAINFLRGRDDIDEWKIDEERAEYLNKDDRFIMASVMNPNKFIGEISKHRGFYFINKLHDACFDEAKVFKTDITWSVFLESCRVNLLSYRSKNNIMDSVIFKLPVDLIRKFNPLYTINEMIDVKKKIAAAKAVRTMRMAA